MARMAKSPEYKTCVLRITLRLECLQWIKMEHCWRFFLPTDSPINEEPCGDSPIIGRWLFLDNNIGVTEVSKQEWEREVVKTVGSFLISRTCETAPEQLAEETIKQLFPKTRKIQRLSDCLYRYEQSRLKQELIVF
jgi:hypothetical protein